MVKTSSICHKFCPAEQFALTLVSEKSFCWTRVLNAGSELLLDTILYLFHICSVGAFHFPLISVLNQDIFSKTFQKFGSKLMCHDSITFSLCLLKQ